LRGREELPRALPLPRAPWGDGLAPAARRRERLPSQEKLQSAALRFVCAGAAAGSPTVVGPAAASDPACGSSRDASGDPKSRGVTRAPQGAAAAAASGGTNPTRAVDAAANATPAAARERRQRSRDCCHGDRCRRRVPHVDLRASRAAAAAAAAAASRVERCRWVVERRRSGPQVVGHAPVRSLRPAAFGSSAAGARDGRAARGARRGSGRCGGDTYERDTEATAAIAAAATASFGTS
jgi:hypothetical protein